MQIEYFKNLINETFTEIKIKEFSFLGSGKCGDTCLVNNEIVFKIPKDIKTNKSQEKEVKILEFLKGKLSFQIPEILFYKTSDDDKFIIAETLTAGTQFTQKIHDSFNKEDKSKLLIQIGKMMRELHDVSDVILPDVPIENYTNALDRFNGFYCDELKSSLSESENKKLYSIMDNYKNLSEQYPVNPVPCHCDLNFANMMLDLKTKSISGFFDFGAFQYAEPSRDMHYYWGTGSKEILLGYGNNGDKHLADRQKFQAVCNLLSNIKQDFSNNKSAEINIKKLKWYL